MLFDRSIFIIIFFLFMFLIPSNCIRSFSSKVKDGLDSSLQFVEAPEYKNGKRCHIAVDRKIELSVCNPWLVHVAMTLDPDYLRGTMAAIHSVLKHASCPENIFFHFVSSNSRSIGSNHLAKIVESAFPSLRFKVYVFDENLVKNLISTSIRRALENPLNYARSYLADMLEACVKRVIYLDSDIIAVDDIDKLWGVPLPGSRTIGAPEYCQANFTNYFTQEFWSDVDLSKVFEGKKACYFNTGVMVMELERWREADYTKEIEKWMRIQKERRIYELGSLPPFLLVFGGDVEAIDHRWNQHGLGGDNVVSSCRTLHSGPVSLLHWSGKRKPWRRLDENKPCPVDSLWAPYDLHKHTSHPHIHHQKRRHR